MPAREGHPDGECRAQSGRHLHRTGTGADRRAMLRRGSVHGRKWPSLHLHGRAQILCPWHREADECTSLPQLSEQLLSDKALFASEPRSRVELERKCLPTRAAVVLVVMAGCVTQSIANCDSCGSS